MLPGLLWTLVTWTSSSLAESPGTLPGGAKVVYSGVGVTTFNRLTQNGEAVLRDREVRSRLDLYGSYGLTDRLQVSVSAPVVHSFVVDDPDELPCPNLLSAEGYCETYLTVGQGRLDARYGVLRDKIPLTIGVAADVDVWNRARRGQYNSAGSGRTMLEGLAVVGAGTDAGGWRLDGLLFGAFGYSLAPDATSADGRITVKAPGDTVRGSLELKGRRESLTFEVGGHYTQRLTGVDLDGQWVDDWFNSSLDRWNVLQYRGIAVSGKASLDLPNSSGLHLGVFRLVSVDNGASNTTDVSIGWHRYFAPRS